MGKLAHKQYLAFDGINCEYEEFDNLEEARTYLYEGFYESGEGYHPDMKSCAIYELHESVDSDIIADKKDFTEEEWEEEGYLPEWDTIIKHKFVPFKAPELLQANRKLKEELGLLKIDNESKTVLLASCENALKQRDEANRELVEALRAIQKHIDDKEDFDIKHELHAVDYWLIHLNHLSKTILTKYKDL